jgi:hypothetical protein
MTEYPHGQQIAHPAIPRISDLRFEKEEKMDS